MEMENWKCRFCAAVCCLLYNPLQRYTRSREIKGRNTETSGQTQGVATLPKDASMHCT